MTFKVNYTQLSEEEKSFDFYNLLSAMIVSRQDLTQTLDLSNITLEVSLNGQSVDIIKSWGLFNGYKNQEQGNNSVLSSVEQKLIDLRLKLEKERNDNIEQLDNKRRALAETISCAARDAVYDALDEYYFRETIEEHITDSLFSSEACNELLNLEASLSK